MAPWNGPINRKKTERYNDVQQHSSGTVGSVMINLLQVYCQVSGEKSMSTMKSFPDR